MSKDEFDEKGYQEYCEYEKSWYDTKEKNEQSRDKIVIAIASSLFGLLLAMNDKIPLAQSECLGVLLKILIVSNGLTLILSLFSFYTANLAIDKKVENFLYKRNERNCWEIATKCLNFGYLATTIITIFVLAKALCEIF